MLFIFVFLKMNPKVLFSVSTIEVKQNKCFFEMVTGEVLCCFQFERSYLLPSAYTYT